MKSPSIINSGKNYQSGQILLISLLVLIVVLVIGLSLAARTISTLRTTSVEDSSVRAFSAAEAGMEKALTATTNTTLTGTLANNSGYKTDISTLTGDSLLLNNGDFLQEDKPQDVWLSTYPNYTTTWSGSVTVYWGATSDVCVDKPENNNTMAALEIISIHGSKAAPLIDHYAYDPCVNRRNSYNHFSSVLAGGSVGGTNFAYSINLPINSGMLLRLVPIYAGTKIAIKGLSLPPQGTVITSVGTSGTTKRKIVTYRGYPTAPIELFPFLIFSPK